MTEFKKYLKQAREEFAYEISKYTVKNNLALRTASDSLLIAFDQATEKAINYSQCCKSDIEQFYCLAKIHYSEMVGDEGCDEQCVRCKLKGQ